jgi:hypothetical protein
MVPVERIELPTFGLQNRCSTAELNRRIEAIGARRKYLPHGSIFGRSNTRLVRKGPEPRRNLARHPAHRKGGLPAAISCSILAALLAEMPPAILAAEPGAGDADKTVAAGIGIAANRSGGDASRCADRIGGDAGCDIPRPEAAVVVPAVPIRGLCNRQTGVKFRLPII